MTTTQTITIQTNGTSPTEIAEIICDAFTAAQTGDILLALLDEIKIRASMDGNLDAMHMLQSAQPAVEAASANL